LIWVCLGMLWLRAGRRLGLSGTKRSLQISTTALAFGCLAAASRLPGRHEARPGPVGATVWARGPRPPQSKRWHRWRYRWSDGSAARRIRHRRRGRMGNRRGSLRDCGPQSVAPSRLLQADRAAGRWWKKRRSRGKSSMRRGDEQRGRCERALSDVRGCVTRAMTSQMKRDSRTACGPRAGILRRL